MAVGKTLSLNSASVALAGGFITLQKERIWDVGSGSVVREGGYLGLVWSGGAAPGTIAAVNGVPNIS